jgi:Protein of unknown function (DUF4012)
VPAPQPDRARKTRRTRRLIVVVAVAAGGSYAGFVYHSLNDARHDLDDARSKLTAARSTLSTSELATADLGPLDGAYASVDRAHRRLSSPWLSPLRPVPFVGRQIASARSLTRTVRDVMRPAVTGLHDLQAVPTDGAIGARVERYTASARQTIELVRRNVDGADLGPADGLLGELASTRREVATALDRLRSGLVETDAALAAAHDALVGPRHYLILGGTNSEMAAGAPIPLARGTLTIENGELSVGGWVWGDVGQKRAPVATPPGPLTDLWSFLRPGDSSQELTQTPSFALAAPLAAAQYRALTGIEIDGVLMVDAEALVALSDLTGPVELGGVERTGAELRRYVLHDQYVPVPGAAWGAERHDAMLDLTDSVFEKLVNGNGDAGQLVATLARLGAARHVLFWSAVPAEQAVAKAARIDGSVADEAVFMGLSNRGANKLDYYIASEAAVTRATRADGSVDVTVDLTIRNVAPLTGESQYVIGPSTSHVKNAGEYAGYLTVMSPRGTSDAMLVGEGAPIVDGYDDGHPVVGRLIRIRSGEAWTGRWTFHMSEARPIVAAPSARPIEVVWSGL